MKEKKLSDSQKREYKTLNPLIGDVLEEIKELSKKKQDGVLNELKVKSINRILKRLKELLKEEFLSDFLDLLDQETLPSNSDAVLIITQFKTALRQFEKKHRIEISLFNL